jgi:hypothetical protein
MSPALLPNTLSRLTESADFKDGLLTLFRSDWIREQVESFDPTRAAFSLGRYVLEVPQTTDEPSPSAPNHRAEKAGPPRRGRGRGKKAVAVPAENKRAPATVRQSCVYVYGGEGRGVRGHLVSSL